MENTNFTPKSSLQTTDSKQNEERNPAKAHAFTSSFTPNVHNRHTGRRSRMISRKKEFSPKPPPHHTPEQNNFEEEEFAGAWKQIVAAVSHDPKVCFSWFSLFPNLDFELGVRIFCLLHRKVSNIEHFLFDENGGWVLIWSGVCLVFELLEFIYLFLCICICVCGFYEGANSFTGINSC